MKVLVLGAGRVGASLARALQFQGEDVIIVDNDPLRLEELGRRMDVERIFGNAAHPDVLQQAGAFDADIVFATTGADEINMVASQICYTLFEVTNIVARIRTPAYLERRHELFDFEHLPIKAAVNPELEMAEELCLIVQHPGARQVLNLGAGCLRLCAFQIPEDWRYIGVPISKLYEVGGKPFEVPLVGRGDKGFPPSEAEQLAADDTLFVLASVNDIGSVMKRLFLQGKPFKRVMIGGGGHLGARLVRELQHRTAASVRLVEIREDRCQRLAEDLSCVVLRGDITSEEFLLEENIEHIDAFFALTNSDEANLLATVIAKRHKTRTTGALLMSPAMHELAEIAGTTLAVSPVEAAVDAFRSYFRRGRVLREHSLVNTFGQFMEIEALGTAETSTLVGRPASSIDLPGESRVFAVARPHKSGSFRPLLISHEPTIQENDRLIVFVPRQESEQDLLMVQKHIERVFYAPPESF